MSRVRFSARACLVLLLLPGRPPQSTTARGANGYWQKPANGLHYTQIVDSLREKWLSAASARNRASKSVRSRFDSHRPQPSRQTHVLRQASHHWTRLIFLDSVLCVPRPQHCLKPGRLFLPPSFRAGLFKPPSLPELLQRLLPVQLLLEPANRSFDRFALFQFYFSHSSD